MQPIGMDAYYTAASDSVGDGLPRADARRLARRSDRNQLRSAMWAFAGVPWVPELTIDHLDWDVMCSAACRPTCATGSTTQQTASCGVDAA